MLVCTLGDLTLDVIVRLARTDRRTAATPTPRSVSGREARRPTSRPGPQRSARAGAIHRTDGRRRRGRSRADEARRLWRRDRAGRSGAETGRSARSSHQKASARWHPTAALRASSAAYDLDAEWLAAAITFTSRATRSCSSPCGAPRSVPPSSHAPEAHGSASISPPGARSAIERRGRVQRGRSRHRAPTSCSPTRTRSASSVARSSTPSGSSSAVRAAARSTATSDAALPVDKVLDSTGAGDALAAGWIVGGPDLALEAAARCVQQIGAMPIASAA